MKHVRYDEEHKTFDLDCGNGFVGDGELYYWIDRRRINNTRDLLAWIRHLSEKRWFTNEHLEEFILVWGRVHNVNFYGLP